MQYISYACFISSTPEQMASESYLNTLDKCPKQIPRPKVRKVQGEPSADSTECSEMNYSEKDVKGKEAQYLVSLEHRNH